MKTDSVRSEGSKSSNSFVRSANERPSHSQDQLSCRTISTTMYSGHLIVNLPSRSSFRTKTSLFSDCRYCNKAAEKFADGKKYVMSSRSKMLFSGLCSTSLVALASVLGASAASAQVVTNDTPNFSGYATGTISGFVNNSLISSDPPALSVTGDLKGDLVNNGQMRSRSHGVSVSGSLNGDFTNSAGSELWGEGFGLFVGQDLNGDVVNEGRIESGNCHGVYVAGTMTGDFVNGSSGQIRTDKVAFQVQDGLFGNIRNDGEIYSGSSHGIRVSGGMLGDFTNSAGAEIHGNYGAVSITNFVGSNGPNSDTGLGYQGNFLNEGLIRSGASHGVFICGGMQGNFTNGATGVIDGNDIGVQINNGLATANDCIALVGDFINQGEIISGDCHGVHITGGMRGDFTNAAGAYIFANDSGVEIRRSNSDTVAMDGNFVNSGRIIGGDSHGVLISGGMTGDFTNAAGAEIRGKASGVRIDGSLGFQGNFINGGIIESGDTLGVFISAAMTGDFTNQAGGRIFGKSFGVGINSMFAGNFTNDAEIRSGASHGVVFSGGFSGNFTNGVQGEIWGTEGGVVFTNVSPVVGSFKNHGEIWAGSCHGVTFQNSFSGDFLNSSTGRISSVNESGVIMRVSPSYSWVGNFTNEGLIEGSNRTPTLVGSTHKMGSGVSLENGLTGNFSNSGTISGLQAIMINGNLNGNFSNTGTLIGNYTGGVKDFSGDYNSGFLSLKGYSTVITGNFDGGLTNVVGQGIFVGTNGYVSDINTAAIKAGTGTADFRGHQVGVHVNSIVTDGFSWTAVDAENLLLDPDFTVNDNSYLFRFNHITADNNLILTAEQTSTIANAIGGAAGDLGIATLLDRYVPGTSPQLDDILGEVHSQPTQDDIERLLNEVSPAGRAMRISTLNTSLLFDDVTNGHLRGSSGGPGTETAALGAGGGVVVPTADVLDTASSAVWLQAFGGSADVDPTNTFGGVDATTLGVAGGVDLAITSSLQLTGALGYYSAEADMTDQNDGDSSDASGWLIAGGMRFQPNAFYLLGSVSVGFHSVDETRTDAFHGDVYSGSYDGHNINVGGEAGYEFSTGGFGLTPYIAATWHSASFDEYEEKGGPLALSVDEQEYSVALVDVGARASASIGFAELTGLVGYRSVYGDDLEGDVTASLGGSEFETAADISMSGFLAGAGLTFVDLAGFDLGGSYRGMFGDDIVSHNVSIDLSKKF